MKKMTVEQKKAKLEQELKRVEAFATVLRLVNNQLKWDYMTIAEDDDGNRICDESGDYMYVEPTEDTWRYDEYIALKSAIEEIENLI